MSNESIQQAAERIVRSLSNLHLMNLLNSYTRYRKPHDTQYAILISERHRRDKASICYHCKIEKPRSQFHRAGIVNGRQRWHARCLDCRSLQAQQRWQTDGNFRERNIAMNRLPRVKSRRRLYQQHLHLQHHPGLRAKQLVKEAVKYGRLKKPSSCEQCMAKPIPGIDGRSRLHAHHHRGYNCPLEVQWLCARCHKDIHRKH